jgi:hypothetical protein
MAFAAEDSADVHFFDCFDNGHDVGAPFPS